MKIAETYKFEKMYDNLIHKYGHEHPIVIQFGLLAERWDNTNWNKKCIEILYHSLIEQEIS